MYNGQIIKHLLLKQNKSQTELSMAVTGRPNSSLHYLAKNPTAKTLERIADFFGVTIDSLFERAHPPVDMETEKDAENGYLKKLIKLQETQMSAYMMLNETNDFILEQLKRRVAELESRLKYLQAHPEAISELPPMPEFNMIVPMVEKQPEVKVYTNMTPEEKKQQRIRKKLAKNAEVEIRKETLPD